MKIDAATARWFSDVLLRIYAAREEDGVRQILTDAEATPAAQYRERLLELLREHQGHRLEQLRAGSGDSPSLIAALTPREREVLERIAAGATDAQIGEALGISPKTASKHVENILHKLCVETRTAAAATLFSPPC